MNKDTVKIKPARDLIRKAACRRLAEKYMRSIDWAYKVSRREKSVQSGEHYQDAVNDYEAFYKEIKEALLW